MGRLVTVVLTIFSVQTIYAQLGRCWPGVGRSESRSGTVNHVPFVTGANPCHDYSLHDCDRQALCESHQPGFFECHCPPDFVDVSPDKQRFPGRKCKLRMSAPTYSTLQPLS
jgi:hypothetical protein